MLRRNTTCARDRSSPFVSARRSTNEEDDVSVQAREIHVAPAHRLSDELRRARPCLDLPLVAVGRDEREDDGDDRSCRSEHGDHCRGTLLPPPPRRLGMIDINHGSCSAMCGAAGWTREAAVSTAKRAAGAAGSRATSFTSSITAAIAALQAPRRP
jgi:hypothetical protein